MNQLSENQAQDLLEDGATMITVNRRLARYFQARFGARQIEKGRSAWETPDILPYSAWLERTWNEKPGLLDIAGDKKPALLSALQEKAIWQQIISGSEEGKNLLQPDETARKVQQAWSLCHQWRVPTSADPKWSAPDPSAFLSWSGFFENRCLEDNFIDRARLPDAVRRALSHKRIVVPEMLIFNGFDESPPQLVDLMGALEDSGARTETMASSEYESDASRIGLADRYAEIDAAARWAKDRLTRFPGIRLGVIVPGLEADREVVMRVFEDILHPDGILSPQGPEQRIFNISMGRPLSGYPIIQTALEVLDLLDGPRDIGRWSRIILSPFIGGADSELSRRAAFDAHLRREGVTRPNAARMLQLMSFAGKRKNGRHCRCPELYKSLELFLANGGRMPLKQTPSKWSRNFTLLLDSLGWPGQRPLSSDEYQCLSAWQDLLVRISSLDEINGAVSFKVALDILHGAADETSFQPEAEEVPVQIMGMLEAAGEMFDHLWVMGLSQENWPPAASPNPFIPAPIQARLNLPHATPERELYFARQVTGRLIASAHNAVISYPLTDGDSRCQPSPLINGIPEISEADLSLSQGQDYRMRLVGSGRLEELADEQAPPLDNPGRIAGGTGALKAQAACPFSACARYRLGAEVLKSPVSGLDAAQRGTLVHLALEKVWDSLKDHETLANMPPARLSMTVSAAVSEAIQFMAGKYPGIFTNRFTVLEQARLHDLIIEWLDKEKQRMPFAVVEKERELTVEIGGISLKTFADRIDRLDDGRMVIIDYKTGQPSIMDWFRPRLAEPQLPLYSISVDDRLGGVLFARVRKGNSAYYGIVDDNSVVPGVKSIADNGGFNENFCRISEVVEYWRVQLEILAEEIRTGHASVSPVSKAASCRYCDLSPLCRIGEHE